MTASVILLAGGSGRRMGGGDKLLIEVRGEPLLRRVLRAIEACAAVDRIVLVARPGRIPEYTRLASSWGLTRISAIVPGGVERQDSVWNGLQALVPPPEIVLIHDAARALVTPDLIRRCAAAAAEHGAAIPAAPVHDTIKRIRSPEDPRIVETLDRTLLRAAQTPQAFRFVIIRDAYAPLIRQRVLVTDDASAAERAGHEVQIVESDATNLKVTSPEDVFLAETILSQREKTS
ncbi:MAG: 2-C-methyl-D-erythritol 4-phosphate cytidylyltransferase [Verrucomicrobiae bacterium]|nr:2-C-methyl-D-erythritol 4-phosphate cytidylyltransferase [Verrucomicrobiae bacterium]